MAMRLNTTHDAGLKSWIDAADDPQTEFPIQNLPLCVADRGEGGESDLRICVAIGDQLADLLELGDAGLLGDPDSDLVLSLQVERLNLLLGLGNQAWSALRRRLVSLFRHDSGELRDRRDLRDSAMFPMAGARLVLPAQIGDYTDFYASKFHATNVGSMFRPDNPLLPNYGWIPIGYHGRSSSIVVSGTPIRRPVGQTRPKDDAPPVFGPCANLDYELEVGAVIGPGNTLGEAIPLARAEEHIFGLCLVNDWSARDIQRWEYQPLGPFLAKNFATTVSPFIVTLEALAPFRAPALARGEGEARLLAYLQDAEDQASGGFDITLEVLLASEEMRKRGMAPVRLSRGGFKEMYWTLGQMVAHHTSNGCNLRPGDLIASGTVSGPGRDSRGCLLELTWDGPGGPGSAVPGTARTPIKLPTGEERRFLADGDEVIIRGWCERQGFRKVGFGECRGVVVGV